jgi:peptidoglycan/xylan/chitin deacetylase (PgdA/CDA1 family)
MSLDPSGEEIPTNQADGLPLPLMLALALVGLIVIVVVGISIVSLQPAPESGGIQTIIVPSPAPATPQVMQQPDGYEPVDEAEPTGAAELATVAPQPTLAPVSGASPYPTLAPLPMEGRGLITNGDRDQAYVALTFDVGETAENPAGYDSEIVRILNDTGTPATFFLGGLWMQHNVEETLELALNPHFDIGNHAWSHLDFAQITPEQMSSEILLTQQEMWRLFDNWQTQLFRLPFGTYTEEALDVIAEHGLYTIQWDVVSGDPDPNITADKMIPWVLEQVQPGSIVIMHANGLGWHTAEALPAIIEELRQQGYTLVTISELLSLEKPQSPVK